MFRLINTFYDFVLNKHNEDDSPKDMYHFCVYSEKLDDGQRNCPKHVEFHSKNKFEKLLHLVGFIVRNLTQCTVT